ncbi:MAG TPA: PAS domain S-box protein [Mucilaginibacter sp.]|jgi:PAS domain S-box-containing protein
MKRVFKILHIEDIQSDAELVERTLKKSGIAFNKIVVDTKDEYTKELVNFQPDIILSDHSLPSFNSLEALKILKSSGKKIPFILITATVSEEFAVDIMKEGASDYVLKDRLQRLPSAVTNAIQKFQLDNERDTYLNKIVASEALFTKAELIAEFGTWRFNIDAKTINWSSGTYPLLGYRHREVEPTIANFLKPIFPEDLPRVENIFKGAANKLSYTEVDFRIKNKDRSTRYIHSQFEIELDEEGKPGYIIGFNQDITSSKLAEIEIQKNIEELKVAAERQSAILNAVPANIVLLNEAGKIVAVNESWRKFTLENNLGVPKYGIDYSYIAISEKATGVDKASETKIARGIKEVIAGAAKEFSMEYSCYSKKKKVWFQIIVAPLADKTKKGAVVLHIDITDRKKAEELMQQSEANMQTIFENTDVAYVLCNAEQKIVSFNSKADELSMLQFNKKLKVGNSAFGYFPKHKIPNLKEAIQKVENNEMISYETSYGLKNGSVKWYEVRWVGVANERKEHIGFILAFKDNTERKIAELEREKMNADLVQRNTDLEQFTYIVSHNFRAPVANILGLTNMLNNFDLDVNESQDVKSALTASINNLDQIIMDMNHILQVSSRVNDKTEVVSFKPLVKEINLSLSNLIQTENVTISFNFDAVSSFTTIKSYMHSIFYNLILNGIKYKRAGVNPVISITTRKSYDKLEIIFKDNGKGIEEKNMKDLFGLYKRFDNSIEGKGLGLFMVKMQVENLGGKVSLQSKPGSGTTFKLEFPNPREDV